MLSRWFRYRRRGLNSRHPRWVALDARMDTDRDATSVYPAARVAVNEVSPWWTHPASGSERLGLPVDRTETGLPRSSDVRHSSD